MNRRIALTVASLVPALFFALSHAFAQQEDPCDQECPTGQKIISHADGDHMSCYCGSESGGMVVTAPDPDVVGVDLDPGQSVAVESEAVSPPAGFEQNPDIS